MKGGRRKAEALWQQLLKSDQNKYVLAHDGSEGDQDAALLWAASLRQGHNPYAGVPGISGTPSATAILEAASLLQQATMTSRQASHQITAPQLAPLQLVLHADSPQHTASQSVVGARMATMPAPQVSHQLAASQPAPLQLTPRAGSAQHTAQSVAGSRHATMPSPQASRQLAASQQGPMQSTPHGGGGQRTAQHSVAGARHATVPPTRVSHQPAAFQPAPFQLPPHAGSAQRTAQQSVAGGRHAAVPSPQVSHQLAASEPASLQFVLHADGPQHTAQQSVVGARKATVPFSQVSHLSAASQPAPVQPTPHAGCAQCPAQQSVEGGRHALQCGLAQHKESRPEIRGQPGARHAADNVEHAGQDGPPASAPAVLPQQQQQQQQTQGKPAIATCCDSQLQASGPAASHSSQRALLQRIPAKDRPAAAIHGASQQGAPHDARSSLHQETVRYPAMPQPCAMTAAAAAAKAPVLLAKGHITPSSGHGPILTSRHQGGPQQAAECQHEDPIPGCNTSRYPRQPPTASQACPSLQDASQMDRQASAAAVVPGPHEGMSVKHAGLPSKPSANSQAPSTESAGDQLHGSVPISSACPGLHKRMTPLQQENQGQGAVDADVKLRAVASGIALEPSRSCQQQALTASEQPVDFNSSLPALPSQSYDLVSKVLQNAHLLWACLAAEGRSGMKSHKCVSRSAGLPDCPEHYHYFSHRCA